MDLSTISIIVSIIAALIAIAAPLITFGVYKEKVRRAEEDIKDLNKSIDKKINKVNETIRELQDFSSRLAEFKEQTQKFIDDKIYQSHSPLSLTPLGEKLVRESGFNDIFKQVKDDLVQRLEKTSPTSKYAVQEKARSLMDSLDKYDAFKPIEDYAFEHGLDYNQILRAGAIQLRDYYFEKHPELNGSRENIKL